MLHDGVLRGSELPEVTPTLTGNPFAELGRAAEKGDEVVHDGMRFQVLDVDGPRIERLEVEFLPEEHTDEELVTAE